METDQTVCASEFAGVFMCVWDARPRKLGNGEVSRPPAIEGASPVRSCSGYAALVLVSAKVKGRFAGVRARPELRHRHLGHRHHPHRQYFRCRPESGAGCARREGGDPSASVIGAKTERERLFIERWRNTTSRFGERAPQRAHQVALRMLSRTWPRVSPRTTRREIFSALYLTATQRRPEDVCIRPQRPPLSSKSSSRNIGPSRRGALPHPQLRLSSDRREGPDRGEALRRNRASAPPRAAHALAHLHARRRLGRASAADQPARSADVAHRRAGSPAAALHAMDYMVTQTCSCPR